MAFSIRKPPGGTLDGGGPQANTGVVNPQDLLYYTGSNSWTTDAMEKCSYPMAADAFALTCAPQAGLETDYTFFGTCVWDDDTNQIVPPPRVS